MLSDEDLARRIGLEAASAWLSIDQKMIDQFAAATGDDQYIHTDPVRAADSQFGGTIAHGFLTLSLLPTLFRSMEPSLAVPSKTAINYGGNRVRFPSPVHSGKRIRARGRIVEVKRTAAGRIQQTLAYEVEIEGQTKPAMIAEWITVFVV